MIKIDNLEEKINYINKNLEEQGKRYNIISYTRLIISLILIVYIINSFKGGIDLLEGVIISIGISLFTLLIVFHIKIKSKEAYLKCKKKVLERYIDRINGEWINFEDIGEEAIDSSHPYTSDLDVFGKGSLFQLINCSNTYIGRNKIFETLKKGDCTSDIKEKQLAVKEISEKFDFSVEVETLGIINENSGKNPEELFGFVANPTNTYNSRILRCVIYVLPIILIVSSFVAYVTLSKVFLNIAFITLIVNILLNGYFFIKGYCGFEKVNPFRRNLKAYLNIVKLIEDAEFKEEYLIRLKKILISDVKASQVISKLESISGYIDLRYNPIGYFILNIIFLWDYQCMYALEDFKRSYGDKIQEYLYAVGQIEELVSLGVISNINPYTTVPNILKSDNTFINTNMLGHPLINFNKRINNSISIEKQILVITGSNMSGKTTFLRTIGINLVLAYAGAPVIAKEFSCSIMNVVTSMRITDNLEMGISTFYAELIRIKNIVNEAKNNKPMIFLIDEIFRGTNSQDRIVGAINVIKNLSKSNIIGCISTHDFELCDIKDKNIVNYHFEEYYRDGNILFDYKIKVGRSTTKNAKYLMRMVGIDIED